MDLKMLEQQLSGNLPPVDQWHPAHCGTMDLLIDRDGQWIHEGSEIKRPEMVKLFYRILRKDADGYVLVTPVEKISIQVAIEPFVLIDAVFEDGVWVFIAKSGERIPLCDQHPMAVSHHEVLGDYPRILVRSNLWAHFHRNLFFRMAEQAAHTVTDTGADSWVLHSADKDWTFG